MNEENNFYPAIHTLATDKIEAKLVNIMFSIEDAKKALKNRIYGGITEEEQRLILDSEQKEKEIYEYILDALDNFNNTNLSMLPGRSGYTGVGFDRAIDILQDNAHTQ
jgi:hypothetical protein